MCSNINRGVLVGLLLPEVLEPLAFPLPLVVVVPSSSLVMLGVLTLMLVLGGFCGCSVGEEEGPARGGGDVDADVAGWGGEGGEVAVALVLLLVLVFVLDGGSSDSDSGGTFCIRVAAVLPFAVAAAIALGDLKALGEEGAVDVGEGKKGLLM